MSDGRSEDRDQPGGTSGRKAPAASDLLALWVTGRTAEEDPADPAEAADRAAPDTEDVPEEEAYAESLWPGDEPPAAGDSPEPVGGEQWWPYAEPEGAGGTPPETGPAAPTAGAEDVSAPAPETPDSMGPRGQDMATTASWTLDDFERYVRNQKDNELADWIGGEGRAPATEPAEQPDDAFSPAPAPAPTPAEVPAGAVSDEDDQDDEADPGSVDPLDEPEVEVEWNPPEGEAPVAEAAPVAEPEPEPDLEPWADWSPDPAAEQDAATEPAEPDPGQAPLFEDPAPEVEDVWPEPEPQPTPAPEAVAEPAAEPQGYDLQEWYDDYGLRWVSGDGGYTWYSDDGQGWDAEHSEVIPVAAGFVPFPGDPRSPGYTAAADPAAPAAPAAPEPDEVEDEPYDAAPAAAVPDPAPGPAPAATDHPTDRPTDRPITDADDPDDPDGWPSSGTGSTAHHYAGLAEDARWPGETGQQPRVDAQGSTQVMSAVTAPSEPAEPDAPAEDASPAEQTSYPLYADEPAPARRGRSGARAEEDVDPRRDESFPEHVEYKPRGAYRPLLILLFVGAAVVAVAAILWAVSKGNQAVWGIAAAVTGFALFFWWGLLSWTPTLVSIDGPMLEVSRGSEGERFDLRSPRLDIRVDDDVYSRGWRATIVRPNGTELVIPSSAVDAEEFSRIVAHHRAGVHG